MAPVGSILSKANATMDENQKSARRGMHHARRVVIKAGTPVVTHVDGNVALGRIGALVEQIAHLRQQGREVVLVSSGAISTGMLRMRKSMTLNSTVQDTMYSSKSHTVPAAPSAAVGQALLMNLYETLFSKYNLSCAQVLITEDDVSDGETLSQVRDTTMELLQLGTIPIINDNDAITSRSVPVMDDETGEIRWDNDSLSAVLASTLRADLLVMLTDLDGLYTAPPDGKVEPERLPFYVPDTPFVLSGIHNSQWLLSDNGRGKFAGRTRLSAEGMDSLVEAARSAVSGGVRCAAVVTGHHPLSLMLLMRGEDVGTLFVNPAPSARL